MNMNRRETLKLLAAASIASAIPGCTSRDLERSAARVAAIGSEELATRTPQVLSAHEYRTVEVLVDYIIPADDRSGSATDAGVPAFIDFTLEDVADLVDPFRGGLAWLDAHCETEHGGRFIDLNTEHQTATLDTIAYPDDVTGELEDGMRFFTLVRDLTASGFFSSRMGVEDLGYIGNTAALWDGCPQDSLDHIGVSYET